MNGVRRIGGGFFHLPVVRFQAGDVVRIAQHVRLHQVEQGLGVLALRIERIEEGAGIFVIAVEAVADGGQEGAGRLPASQHVEHHPPAVALRVGTVIFNQRVVVSRQVGMAERRHRARLFFSDLWEQFIERYEIQVLHPFDYLSCVRSRCDPSIRVIRVLRMPIPDTTKPSVVSLPIWRQMAFSNNG